MKPEKPITQNMREKANRCYTILYKVNGYVTKEQLGKLLGITNERSVRDVISLLATRCPIISTSDNRGYKLAKTKADLEEVEHTWAELSSRIEEIERRIQPLIKFKESI